MKTLIPLTLLTLSAPVFADTVGHWRFDDADAAPGADIFWSENIVDPGDLDAVASGGLPVFSDDVPAAEIFDPVTGETYTNGFSFNASGSADALTIADSELFNTSFTVEFFIKMTGEPASYESVLRRQETNDLKWQIDFDHGVNTGFGRLRTRWDTPAGFPDGAAENGFDENVNFVVGPQGNANAPKVYIDTGAKDEFGDDVGPQNTGNPQDYIYDNTSLNPNETDVALQGDGVNDVAEWHHVAVSFDQETGEIRFYFDYLLSQTRTLADTEEDGYTHPLAEIRFGKLSNSDYGLLLDELRYSNTVLSPGSFLREPRPGGSNTIAHWRIDDDLAIDGEPVFFIENETSPLHEAAPASATPSYSTDVPAPMILDPLTSTTYTNAFSLDASLGNARMAVQDDVEFDTNFTLEMFIKIGGEPGGYHTFLRRREANDLRWQIDFDHAANTSFGRIRSRWDNINENANFVVGPGGGVNAPKIFVDTGAKDEFDADVGPQNTGDPLDYIFDNASLNPNENDIAFQGDGINDNPAWHHVALTFDQETGTVGFYFDYELSQTRTLLDPEGDGYTHPAAPIEFGKFANADYALWIDEVRYSGKVLLPFEFLQVVNPDAPEFRITGITHLPGATEATVTWLSTPGKTYAIDRSTDLAGQWDELATGIPADTDSASYTDTSLPAALESAFYRVRQVD